MRSADRSAAENLAMADSGGAFAWITAAKDLAECLAFLSAGGFFAYKTGVGYLKVDLSLKAHCERRRHATSQSEDFLIIHLHLNKGPNGSLGLHDARALITNFNSKTTQEVAFPGTRRSSFKPAPDGESRVITWKQSDTEPLLRIVPNEQTDLAALCTVPADAICVIEVAVLGKRDRSSRYAQWKASCVSLPAQ